MDNNRLYKTIAEVLGVPSDSINDDSSPETIPTWDSLNHLNIVMALEFECVVVYLVMQDSAHELVRR